MRLIIGLQEGPRNVRCEKEERYRGKHVGTWGELVTVPITVALENDEDEFQIRACFEGAESWTKYSTSCFWVGVHDAPNIHDTELGQWFTTGQEDLNYDMELDIGRWKFGNEASIHYRLTKNADERAQEIRMSLHIRPYFGSESSDFRLVLKSDTWKGGLKQNCEDRPLNFRLDKNAAMEGGAFKYRLLQEHGALSNRGDGNCVHPKQLFTSHAAYQLINEETHLKDKKKINICYIGPDSTENLRSLGRLLKSKTDKEYSTTVAYFESWDVATAIAPFGDQYTLDTSPLNIELKNIDEVIQAKKKIQKMDIVVATYVTPWSLSGTEGDKEKYRKLLKKVINKDTIFLTVEPAETSACVIEIAPDKNGHEYEEYYENVLNLQGVPIVWRETIGLGKSEQCITTKWRLKRSGGVSS